MRRFSTSGEDKLTAAVAPTARDMIARGKRRRSVAPGPVNICLEALKGRNKISIPDVTLIIIHSVSREKFPILILKRHPTVVLFLMSDVSLQRWRLRLTN